MAGGAAESGRSVTSKVTAILMVFSRGSSYSLTELAHLAGLPVSTAHRLAGELAARRLLERTDDGGYRIGLPLRMIGTGPTSPPPLLRRAADALACLAAATGSPARIGMLDGSAVVEAAALPGQPPDAAFHPSARPVVASALGRVLLAFSPPSVVGEVLADPVPDRLRRSLGATRISRVAVCPARGRAGGGAVAMPVFGAGGALLAAVEIDVADLATGMRSARAALVVTTGSLSRQLATADPAEAAAG